MKNNLGVRSVREIGWEEYRLLLDAAEHYVNEQISAQTQFTARLIRQMHLDWLGSLYQWAGNYRTVNLSKGGFTWPPANLVPELMEKFERSILSEHTPCRPGSLESVAESIAVVHGELLLIHPFREGNGRLARWLADLMANQAGFPPPSYRFTGRGSVKRREEYLNAVKRSYLMEYQRLGSFFADALEAALTETE